MSLIRIDKLFNFEKGILQSSKCNPGKYNFITASSEWKTHNKYTHDCEALIFAAAASGSLGRTHYVKGKFISSDLCFIITPKDPINLPIDLKFYHLIFNELKDEIVRNTKAGTSKEAIGLAAFGKYELPYFDIDKQIEAKEQFVNAFDHKKDLNSELTHQLSLIKQLRQSFLREAMQGKLLPQIASEGNGRDLLAQIKAEKQKLMAEKKLKKEKNLPAINTEEIPFDIPGNWVWCRLEETCEQIFDMEHKMPKAINSNGVMFLSAKDLLDNGTINYCHNIKLISNEEYEYLTRNFKPKKFDIIYSRRGANLGKSRIVEIEQKYLASYSCCIIRSLNPCLKYINLLLDSGIILKQATLNTTNNSIPDLGVNKIKDFKIPLPPLSEQQRIVAKLEELMAYCDKLEKSINGSKEQNEMLLQQVLRETLREK
ncbi:MAG: restriction endonuclease subunit S [Bacteroidales bacterium]